MQLEEKQIPYVVEKINMRCYGPKPSHFLAKVRENAEKCVPVNTKVCAKVSEKRVIVS